MRRGQAGATDETKAAAELVGRILRAFMRGAVPRHDAVLHAPDGSARRWLDRALVVPVLGLEDAAFFDLPE